MFQKVKLNRENKAIIFQFHTTKQHLAMESHHTTTIHQQKWLLCTKVEHRHQSINSRQFHGKLTYYNEISISLIVFFTYFILAQSNSFLIVSATRSDSIQLNMKLKRWLVPSLSVQVQAKELLCHPHHLHHRHRH